MMDLLLDEKYHKVVSALMENAQSEILIVSFLFGSPPKKLSDRVMKLYSKLIEARHRGLVCRVILNYTVPENTVGAENKTVSAWLASNGIQCRYLPRNRVVHAKIVIIDGVSVIVGSHNWTRRAGERNFEASILSDSKPVIEKARETFLNLWEDACPMPN
ncbi:MAG: phospholipase D-like domain-containing protein [Candidatus Aminicenantes bacterium]|nr:phospholipase D-like domain-containing protein [Candidatus Aminicenantes bacterium]